jgi:hypothetical protein
LKPPSDPTGDRIRSELRRLDAREAALRAERHAATYRLEQVLRERERLEAPLRHAEKASDRGVGGSVPMQRF